jgi:cysteine synthase
MRFQRLVRRCVGLTALSSSAAAACAGKEENATAVLAADPAAPLLSPSNPPFPLRRGGAGGAVVTNLGELVGGTPLVILPALSAATGCIIAAKAEFLEPSGSVKDRAAAAILADAEASGRLVPTAALAAARAAAAARGVPAAELPTDLLVEGTGGNTGIGLAMLAASRG